MRRQVSETDRYFLVSFFLALLFNLFAFQIGRLLTQNRFHYSLALPFDPAIPFLPWTISVYIGVFVFWVFLYRYIAGLPREQADRFYGANLLGKAICFLLFVLFPTTIARPAVTGTGVWDRAIRLLYFFDRPDCLFPSIHCQIGWSCWAAVRGRADVPWRLRVSALIQAVLVCISTLTTRQHVLADVFAGILLSELCYGLFGISALRRVYSRLADRLICRVFP